MMVPTWIFIVLIVGAGIISILTIMKIFETSCWFVISLLVLSGGFLTYWVGSAIAEGCKVQAGFPIAAVAIAMILFTAIKNHQRENKCMESNSCPAASPNDPL